MSTSPINNLSSSYFESTLATSGNSSKPSSTENGLSTFAQLLGTSASSAASCTAAGTSSSTNSPNEMLQQMMASFKSNGVQSEASSFDPMSIG